MPQRRLKPSQPHDACRVYGALTLNKVAGNFHVTAGKVLPIAGAHAHMTGFMEKTDYNFTHRNGWIFFISLTLSLRLSLIHIHAHTHSLTHTQSHSQSQSNSLTLNRTKYPTMCTELRNSASEIPTRELLCLLRARRKYQI